MTETKALSESPEASLATLRVDIDRIDAEMHRLLMERGEIIDRLIGVKERQGGGSAFRPVREADMMRRLVQRHRGLLPLDTVEGIWRIIIATFTFVQSSYRVHVDVTGGDPPMRDSARFHFGFTVPYIPHESATSVIKAVSFEPADLGILRIDSGMVAGAWWHNLTLDNAPAIIARLPFVARPDHPAGLDVFVISKPLAEAAARDVIVYAATLNRWDHSLAVKLSELGGEILGKVGTDTGLSLLFCVPGTVGPNQLHHTFLNAGFPDIQLHEIGSHAAVHRSIQTEQVGNA